MGMIVQILWTATGGPFFIRVAATASSHGIVGWLALALLMVLVVMTIIRWAEIGLYSALMAMPKFSRGHRQYALSHLLLPLIFAQALVIAVLAVGSLFGGSAEVEIVGLIVALVAPRWLRKEVWA